MRNTNSIGDHILAHLFSCRSTRRYFEILKERRISRENNESVRTAMYRLLKKGLIEWDGQECKLTGLGSKLAAEKTLFTFLPSPFQPKAPDGLLLSFDIPETKRHTRNWLRSQLKIFGYRMIQQSLWIGPAPLPKEFNNRLLKLNIKNCIKTYKIQK